MPYPRTSWRSSFGWQFDPEPEPEPPSPPSYGPWSRYPLMGRGAQMLGHARTPTASSAHLLDSFERAPGGGIVVQPRIEDVEGQASARPTWRGRAVLWAVRAGCAAVLLALPVYAFVVLGQSKGRET